MAKTDIEYVELLWKYPIFSIQTGRDYMRALENCQLVKANHSGPAVKTYLDTVGDMIEVYRRNKQKHGKRLWGIW